MVRVAVVEPGVKLIVPGTVTLWLESISVKEVIDPIPVLKVAVT